MRRFQRRCPARNLGALLVGLGLCSVLETRATAQQTSPLAFTSSSATLQASFDWAKQQALRYARPANGSIGPWYEAALPGRNAFCIRDASHQAEGAAALGLNAANEGMFRLFAGSVAEERDWAGYWEIASDGKPSTADFVSNADFWYNLPANFDLLDATIRLWRWTGDDRYRDDPAFGRLAQTTMHQFLERWQLTPKTLLRRPRIANRRAAQGKFVEARGIPSYTEETKDFIFGTDQLAAQIAAASALGDVASAMRDNRTAEYLKGLQQQWQVLLERVGWSEQQHHYWRTVHPDLTATGYGDVLVLYFNAVSNPAHRKAALDAIAAPQYWRNTNIEEASYIPLTLFRYGRNAAAYDVLADLTRADKPRREYPENSFAVLEAIVSGVMGVEAPHPGQAYDVRTLSRLPGTQTATLSSLSMRGHLLDVTHAGSSSSRLHNVSGSALQWRAAFAGFLPTLLVDGRSEPAHHEITREGLRVSWVDVPVPQGGTVEVRR